MQISELRKSLLESNDYRELLRLVVGHKEAPRGLRKRLAESAGCQQAYFSQVLAGDSHLTPEQAEKLASFWALGDVEAEYFFSLVLENRAGTTSLRSFLSKKRDVLRKQLREETFHESRLADPERATKYYSHWLYSAVHVLLSVPHLRKPKNLAAHLHLPLSAIEEALAELAEMKLALENNGVWILTSAYLYAGDSGTHTDLHHRNWRIYATALEPKRRSNDLRYTCAHTLSRGDFIRIRQMLEDQIRQTRLIIDPSAEELGACLLIDWIEL